MTMRMSRRSFLGSFVGLAALPLAAAVRAAPLASASAADIIASAPSLPPMWAAGTPGEFNWQPISADTAEEAFAKWCDQAGLPVDEWPPFSNESVRRMPLWDGRTPDEVRPADWIEGGLGHGCQRCDCEVMADSATIVEGEVICHECMTYGEKLGDNEDLGMDSLVELICDKGEEGAQAYLIQHEDFELIGIDRWSMAVSEAARWAA
ncbi:hypothetical protein HFO56_39595 [Rhizobium laguerreae]|uniref:hypothetical protein n=1 Tax=Rhizobium laguerreae TaxID=1076926 RepID=UPI001C92948F|nr:hypothetical protein [Rhizobium laguerreae]MBY3158406.1 hypothetical protein [Rhizobium laguerreae]